MRGYNYKTVGYTGALIRKSNRFFADIELEIQRSDTVDWQLGLQHLHYTRWATISGGIKYQQGTQWFGARPSPGRDSFSTARLINLTASLNLPFLCWVNNISNISRHLASNTHDRLSLCRINFLLAGEIQCAGLLPVVHLWGHKAGFLKMTSPRINQQLANQLYLGLDYGEVSNKGGQFLLGDRLVGAVIGVRGYYRRLGYDFNISTPLDKPAHFNTDPIVLGFILNWQY